MVGQVNQLKQLSLLGGQEIKDVNENAANEPKEPVIILHILATETLICLSSYEDCSDLV